MYGRLRARPSRSARHAPPVYARCVLLGVLLLTAAAGSYAARALVADLYGDYAREQQRKQATSRVALDAAAVARRLAPWRAQLHASYAYTAALRDDPAAANPALARSLELAPGDAFAWRQQARVLALGGEFGAPLVYALKRVEQLAPNARGLDLTIALDGVHYWRHGSTELHELWRGRMRRVLRHAPQPFLLAVVRAQRERYFCGYLGAELKLQRWCGQAERYVQNCNSGRANEAQIAWCRRYGLMRDGAVP
ncbi:MAG TPA: hypothetical protein VM074_03910 [Solimonas sp.]|nr:hypothetical protein [Solimonas sp.]